MRDKIATLKAQVEQYQGKIKLCQEEKVHNEEEKTRKKETDLVEKTSDERKFLRKAEKREFANTMLGERRNYKFVEIKKSEAEEEEPSMITINGAACRTPVEDIKWEEEQKELEANAPKGGKAPAKGGKKK